MTEKQINRWLRRQFAPIAWVLLGYYVLINLAVTLTMVLDMAKQAIWSFAAGDFRMEYDMDAIMSNAWGYIAAMGVLALIFWAWKGSAYWKREVFARSGRMRLSVWFTMLALCMGAQMVNTLWLTLLESILNCFGGSVMPMLENVSGSADSFSMFLYASFLAPLTEELLFRGYVLRSLQPYGKRFAIVGSAVFFGLFHGNLLQMPYAVLMGLVMGYLTVEYSIVWAISLHVFNNLVLADLLTRLTAGLSEIAMGMINLGLFGGFFLISAGILIGKRREIREYNRSEWIDRRCVKCLFGNGAMVVLLLILGFSMASLFFV